MKSSTVINIRLTDETRRRLKVMAATLDVTQGKVIELALDALQREGKRKPKGVDDDTK